ncbi:hypothetical protein [Micromonospora sp. NPDC003776]
MADLAETTLSGWQASAEEAGRRLAGITAAGALLGVLVGGVGGRLAMMLLARLNPHLSGLTSDDGFTMGRFTVANTLQLLGTGLQFGLLGVAFYAVLRALMIGPRWFQVLTIGGGPAIVVGAVIVHPDGLDFTLLGSPWLGIALFMAIPGLYAGLLTVLAERWIRPDGWFAQAPLAPVLLSLALWLPLAPVLPVLGLLWLARQGARRLPAGAALLAHPSLPWIARLGLIAIFVIALVNLAHDVSALT